MSSHIAFANEVGQVYVAGPNTAGQLSLGTTTQTNTFTLAKTDATTNISGIVQTSVGASHTLMLRSTGTAYSCGLNTNGQLGLGTTVDTSFVELVLSSATATLGNITSVAAGASHSLFLLSDGSALACGLNTSSQLGDGTTTQRTFPVNVLRSGGTFLGPVVSLAGGTSHSVFATTDGSAWCCGLNATNQLGDGTTTTRSFATRVQTGVSSFLAGVIQVAAGESHSLALTNSGTVFGWGRNNSGQLALGTTTDSPYATQCLYALATPMTGIVSIAAHANHSLFLTASGTVFACGLNGNGQLGDGTLTNRLYPVLVSTAPGSPLTDVVSIGTAGNQSYFVKADGRVFACGNGQTGGLGNGATVDSSYALLTLSAVSSGIKALGYNAAYWRAQGLSAATLASGGYTAYDLVNAGYNKTEMANAGITISNIVGDSASLTHLYRAGYSHNEIVNASSKNLVKMGQQTAAASKIGVLMSGGILDPPRGLSVSGRDASSISVGITAPGVNTGLTGYSVSAVPVSGGSTVTRSLGVAGTLVDGLAGGKIYDLRVRSVGANGNSPEAVVQNSTSLTVPSSVTSSFVTQGRVSITFDSSLITQDCSYVLRTNPNVAQYVLNAGNRRVDVSGLNQNTPYNLIIDASNAYTTSSTNVNVTTLQYTPRYDTTTITKIDVWTGQPNNSLGIRRSLFSGGTWGAFSNIDNTNRYYTGVALTDDGNLGVACEGLIGASVGRVYIFTWSSGAYTTLQSTNDTAGVFRNYTGVAITPTGNRIVTCVKGGFIYFADWNSGTSNFGVFTKTLDDTQRSEHIGISISRDGSRIVYCNGTGGVFYANWDSLLNNYSTGIQITTGSYYAESSLISFDKDVIWIIVYNNTNTLHYSFWNDSRNTYDAFSPATSAAIPSSLDAWNCWINPTGRIMYVTSQAVTTYYRLDIPLATDIQMLPPQTPSVVVNDNFTVTSSNYSFQNGNYVASASSSFSTLLPHRLFDGNDSTIWHVEFPRTGGPYTQTPYTNSGTISTYRGGGGTGYLYTTTIDGTGYSGEWAQIQFPYSFVLKSYVLVHYEYTAGAGWNSRGPATFYVAGSNNGTTWTMLNSQNFATVPAGVSANLSLTINVTTSNAYSYYRLVVNKVFTGSDGGVVNLKAWNLRGTI
jgi:alpha-tubulin suppressor-like RCC1 family protein